MVNRLLMVGYGLFFLLTAFSAVAQDFPLERLPIENGPSQNFVNCIFQDSRGFLWVGSNSGGLSRFDGYNFKVFRYNPFDSLSLIDNRVMTIIEDQDGFLWVGTRKGINVFDPQLEVFHKLHGIGDIGTVETIVEGWDGSIWFIGQLNDIYRIEFSSEKRVISDAVCVHLKGTSSPETQFIPNISGLVQVDNNRYWLNSVINRKSIAFEYDTISKSATIIQGFQGLSKDLQEKLSGDFLQREINTDQHKNFWLHIDEKIIKFEKATQQFSTFPLTDSSGFLDNSTSKSTILLNGANGYQITSKEAGRLILQHQETNKISIIDEAVLHQVRASDAKAIDSGGIIWFGTMGQGILRSDAKSKRFASGVILIPYNDSHVGVSVRSIFETSNDELIISGTGGGGLWVKNEKGNSKITGVDFTVYNIHSDPSHRIWAGGDWLYELIKDKDGNWKGTKAGRIYMNQELQRSEKGDSGNKICDIIDADDGGLWVVTPFDICHFDKNEKVFSCANFKDHTPIYNPAFSTLYKESTGHIWIGFDGGLLKFNPQDKSFKRFAMEPGNPKSLSHNTVKCIEPDFFDPDRYLWIGTGSGGLNRFDKQNGTFEHFTEKDGLPDMMVYGALFDDSGLLWMSTNKGLSVFNTKSKSFQNFDVNDGLQDNEFNSVAYHKGKSGHLYFGGIYGLNAFMPSEILKANEHIPQVIITDFKISNKSVSVRDSLSPIKKAIPYATEVVLNHDQKSFSFEFAALDFTEPSKNQYAVKMDGFDDNWQFIGTNRTATYANLDPGKYTFRVKGSNNNKIWNEEGTSVRVVVLPPWWQTWWAYLGYALVIGGLIYYYRKRKIREQELQHQLEMEQVEAEKLKEVDQLKSRFFANISHEFRTPLTLILGQIESSKSRIQDENIQSKLEMAFRNGKRLLQLINQLLDLSKLEAGSMSLHAEEKDLIPFLKNLFYSFESLANQHKISLAFKSHEKGLSLFFDEYKLEKVFYNLLSNAIKFTPENGKIEMTVEKAIDPFFVKIVVQDSGIGIPVERLPFVFDRFYQVDSSRTREKEGTGIGLALVKEFVELHKGKVEVQSLEESGTVFIVQLPFGESTEKVEESVESIFKITPNEAILISEGAKNALAQSGKESGKAQLLIVEDNNDVRFYLNEHLTEAGYQVLEAVNGAEGLSLAQEHLPDLILTDVMMPKMDGYEFSRHIRADERTSHIPLIILTAKAAEADKIEGLEIGVDDYLTKPFSSKELLVRVANLISMRLQLRERFSTATIIRPTEVSPISVDQQFLEKVLHAIEKQISDDQFGVEPLSDVVHMSVTHLNRKLNALIGQSAGNLIRSMRLQRAADLLIQNAGNVKEIAYLVGYNVPENFSRSFKKQFGCTPGEYQKQKANVQK